MKAESMSFIRLYFLYAENYTFGKAWKTTEHRTPYSLIRYITEGEGLFIIDDELYNVKSGDIIYVPFGANLYCETITQKFSFISIRFTSHILINNIDFLSAYYNIKVHHNSDNTLIYPFFLKILTHANSSQIEKNFVINGCLDLIIAYLIEQSEIKEISSIEKVVNISYSDRKLDQRIQLVLNYINSHPFQMISLTSLSELAHLSESRLRTLFKEQVGVSPKKYMNEIKLLAASKLLLETQYTIKEISHSVGFNDYNYFIRLFKINFGMTPTSFRKELL